MPVITNCPECSRKVRVPDDLLGKKVRCPGCKVVFAAAAVPEEVPEEAPAPPPRRPAPAREERIRQAPPARRAPPPEEDDEAARPRAKAPAGDFQEEQDFEEEEDFEEDELPRGRREHEDDEEGNGDALPPSGKRSAWRKVWVGINAILIALCIQVLSAIVSFFGGMALAAATAPRPGVLPTPGTPPGGTGPGVAFLVFLGFVTVIQLVGSGFNIFGHYKCMSAPDKPGSGLRSLSVAQFILFAIAIGFSVVGQVVQMASGMSPAALSPMAMGAGGILGIFSLLSYCAGFVVFILFLRAVALAVRRRNLAKALMAYLITWASAIGLGVVMALIATAVMGVALFSGAGAGRPAPGAAGAVMGGAVAMMGLFCLGAVGFFGLGIWHVVQLVQVRGALASYAHRA